MNDASLQHFGCFAHSLQLVIQDGLLSQRAVIDIIAICKSIVGHFHRSSVASHNLKRIQESLNVPQHKLIQNISNKVEFHILYDEINTRAKNGFSSLCS